MWLKTRAVASFAKEVRTLQSKLAKLIEKRKLESQFLPMYEVDETIISNTNPAPSIPMNRFTSIMGVLMLATVFIVWNNLVMVCLCSLRT